MTEYTVRELLDVENPMNLLTYEFVRQSYPMIDELEWENPLSILDLTYKEYIIFIRNLTGKYYNLDKDVHQNLTFMLNDIKKLYLAHKLQSI